MKVVHKINLASHRLREFLRLSAGRGPGSLAGWRSAGAGAGVADRTQANVRKPATALGTALIHAYSISWPQKNMTRYR